MSGTDRQLTQAPSALLTNPGLAEALDELVDQYGLDLVMDAIEEIAEECEGD